MVTGREDPDEQDPVVRPSRRPRHRKGDMAAMVAVLVRGGTQLEAAAAAGISEREVRRRVHEPDVVRLVRSGRREHQRRMMTKISDAGLEALETLRELQGTDQPVETRFKASKELFRAAVHNLDSLATREDLDDLQIQVDALLSPDASELDR